MEKEITKEWLSKLGLKAATQEIESTEKIMFAYSNYEFITPEDVSKFNERLKKETMIETPDSYSYKKLVFIALEKYEKIPPADILEKLEVAQEKKCFDRFEIAKVDWIEEVKDPILFGRIDNCDDYFFVGQWDDDVKFEDVKSGVPKV